MKKTNLTTFQNLIKVIVKFIIYLKKKRDEIIEKYRQRNLIQEKSNYIFTDKTLDNFFYINLIKDVFPNAKVINCVRDPLLSIVSIIKHNFPSVPWSHNVGHIFKYFDIYYNKIEFYKKKYPKLIYDIELENFVSNPEIEAKKLCQNDNFEEKLHPLLPDSTNIEEIEILV